MSVREHECSTESPPPTLPDLLADGLDVVFVGINPSIYSAQHGRYFARSTNRFWPCLSHSVLSLSARTAFGVERLGPQHDRALLGVGIGFTDLAKRPTARAGDLRAGELAAGAEQLVAKLERYRPRVACFHGVTGFRIINRILTGVASELTLGLQDLRIGATQCYLVPNPSGANAHFTPVDQTRWYDNLAEYLHGSNA